MTFRSVLGGPLAATAGLVLTAAAAVPLLGGCRQPDRTEAQWSEVADAAKPADTEGILLSFQITYFDMRLWQLEVHDDGLCRATIESLPYFDPIGLFETKLRPSDLAPVSAAAKRAARARLKDIPQPTHGETETRCRVTLRKGQTTQTVSFPDIRVPRALRELYRYRDTDTEVERETGLLVDLLEKVKKYPRSAVVLSAKTDKEQYDVGDKIELRVYVRNVGTDHVAIASPECQELVGGEVNVGASYYEPDVRDLSRAAPFRFLEIVARKEFPRLSWGPLGETLTPEATNDLQNVWVLGPGEERALWCSDPIPAEAESLLEFSVCFETEPRYEPELVSAGVGAPFVTGSACTLLTVRVRE